VRQEEIKRVAEIAITDQLRSWLRLRIRPPPWPILHKTHAPERAFLQAAAEFQLSLLVICIEGNRWAFQHVAVLIEIAPDRYQPKSTGLLSLYPYPHRVPWPCDLVVQVHRLIRGKLFFLNFDNVAYPESRVNNKVTNFELHEVLLKLATNFHRKFLVLVLLMPR
jgi:hypothetical protein